MGVKRLTTLLLGLFSLTIDAAPPQRVVSLNLCSDQLLLMLASPEQVASVSHLAVEPSSSFVARRAAAYPLNHARLEEIILLQPDLVITVPYTNPRLVSTLHQLGFETYQLALGSQLSEIRSEIAGLAERLGQQARGAAIIETIRQRIGVEAQQAPADRPSALFYQPRGYTSAAGTLQDEAMRLAGWRNPATEAGLNGYVAAPLEQVIEWQPELLITSTYGEPGASRAEQLVHHPALKSVMKERPSLEVPYKYWICPGPMLAEAVTLLRNAHQEAP
ncbi:MAG: ABC transporter substrate-binding protein [Candidatus Thiodiazotropha endolucinida]|nr:ABC transporter substrate-binding protein [Candidatus Thiodiazotropha taylori]MCW4316031.1 ABC transporter substrate-binding protein [Candidatus Thiodiazotropha taylori]